MNKIMYRLLITCLLIVFTAGISYAVSLEDIQSTAKQLEEKKRALDEREQQLNNKEGTLRIYESELMQREKFLEGVRDEIDEKLSRLADSENEELDKLAKVYSSAKPKAAAQIFVNMDLVQAATLMRRIQPSTAGRIMSEISKVDPVYASQLTSEMAGNHELDSLADNK